MVDMLMAIPFLMVLLGGVILTVVSRGIQFRGIALMFRLLFRRQDPDADGEQTVGARKALFTAMSTTIGIGNIVGPIIAIGFGGPGALVCYVLASVFGAATTFSEVALAVKYRKTLPDGTIMGGPMQYLRDGISPLVARVYAVGGSVLLLAWSTNQSNTLGSLLLPYGVANAYTGVFLAVTVTVILVGGIKRVAVLNERMVPFMFVLYCSATLWVIGTHYQAIPGVCSLIIRSFLDPRAIGSGIAVHTTLEVLRWGLARAVQANEAGVGTSTIPHSMTASSSALEQGVLAMASVYSNGILCLLTGFTVLVTDRWQQAGAVFDITMLAGIFSDHLPGVGVAALGLSAFLFAFGTIIGNCYNGSQCFLYLVQPKRIIWYQVASGLAVFLGTLFNLEFVWTFIDFLILPVVVPHIVAVVWLVFKGKISFQTAAAPSEETRLAWASVQRLGEEHSIA